MTVGTEVKCQASANVAMTIGIGYEKKVTSCVIDSRRALLFFFANKHSRTHEKIRHFADSYKS